MNGPLSLLTRDLGVYFIAVWVGALVLTGVVAGLGALWARRRTCAPVAGASPRTQA